MNLPLFDAAPASPTPPPEHDPRPTDVLRRVRPKAGPFYLLRAMTEEELANPRTPASALIIGEFDIVELYDGRIFREFSDGRREPAPTSLPRVLIDDALLYGTFIEVSGGQRP